MLGCVLHSACIPQTRDQLERGLDYHVIVANDDLRQLRGVQVLAVKDKAAYAMSAKPIGR
jgi:hypothetical protein